MKTIRFWHRGGLDSTGSHGVDLLHSKALHSQFHATNRA